MIDFARTVRRRLACYQSLTVMPECAEVVRCALAALGIVMLLGTSSSVSVATTYTVSTTAGLHGHFDPPGVSTWTAGTDATINAVPDPGYHVEALTVDDFFDYPGLASWTFPAISGNHTLAVTFSNVTYTVTATAGPHGTITPAGISTWDSNSNAPFTITPDPGYSIATLTIDGASSPPYQAVTFVQIQANHTIAATFAPILHTIAAYADAGGSIDPAGSVPVPHGAAQRFTITPDPGHTIVDVLVDGVSVGAVGSYTFVNVIADHRIEAIFTAVTWTVTANAGVGGTIAPAGAVSVVHGASQTFTLIADPGYAVADVVVDGASVGAVAAYTFVNVVADHTIDASFAEQVTGVGAAARPAPSHVVLSATTDNALGPQVRFQIGAPSAGRVSLTIVDGAGRRVASLPQRDVRAGYSSIPWEAVDDSGQRLARGVYVVRASLNGETSACRLLRIR